MAEAQGEKSAVSSASTLVALRWPSSSKAAASISSRCGRSCNTQAPADSAWRPVFGQRGLAAVGQNDQVVRRLGGGDFGRQPTGNRLAHWRVTAGARGSTRPTGVARLSSFRWRSKSSRLWQGSRLTSCSNFMANKGLWRRVVAVGSAYGAKRVYRRNATGARGGSLGYVTDGKSDLTLPLSRRETGTMSLPCPQLVDSPPPPTIT